MTYLISNKSALVLLNKPLSPMLNYSNTRIHNMREKKSHCKIILSSSLWSFGAFPFYNFDACELLQKHVISDLFFEHKPVFTFNFMAYTMC